MAGRGGRGRQGMAGRGRGWQRAWPAEGMAGRAWLAEGVEARWHAVLFHAVCFSPSLGSQPLP